MKKLHAVSVIGAALLGAIAFGGCSPLDGSSSPDNSARLSPFFDGAGRWPAAEVDVAPGSIHTLPEQVSAPKVSVAVVTITGGKVISHVTDFSEPNFAGPNADAARAEYGAERTIEERYPLASEFTGTVTRWLRGSGPATITFRNEGGWLTETDGKQYPVTWTYDALPEKGRTYVVFLAPNRDDPAKLDHVFDGRGIFDVLDGKLRVIDSWFTKDIREQVQGMTLTQFAGLVAAQ